MISKKGNAISCLFNFARITPFLKCPLPQSPEENYIQIHLLRLLLNISSEESTEQPKRIRKISVFSRNPCLCACVAIKLWAAGKQGLFSITVYSPGTKIPFGIQCLLTNTSWISEREDSWEIVKSWTTFQEHPFFSHYSPKLNQVQLHYHVKEWVIFSILETLANHMKCILYVILSKYFINHNGPFIHRGEQ